MSRKILVVDDEEAIRAIIKEYLGTFGYIVEEAADGEAALVKCYKTEFDLVISDIRMPKMNGLKLLKSIKSTFPKTPVVLITAYRPSKSQEAHLSARADGYLLKPFSLASLKSVIIKIFKKL